MANIRITPTDHRAALSLYTGQAARTREDHTRRPSPEAVAQAEANHAAALAAYRLAWAAWRARQG